MDLKRTSKWLNGIALIVAIVISILVMFFTYELDHIVNTQLYDFSLRYDLEWWNPFHLLTTVMYTSLGAIIVLSGLSLGLRFKVIRDESSSNAKPKQPQIQFQPFKPTAKEKDIERTTISCPHCKKVFSKPIVMLNFEGGKTRLVNICPHCNHTLGNAEESDKNETISIPKRINTN